MVCSSKMQHSSVFIKYSRPIGSQPQPIPYRERPLYILLTIIILAAFLLIKQCWVLIKNDILPQNSGSMMNLFWINFLYLLTFVLYYQVFFTAPFMCRHLVFSLDQEFGSRCLYEKWPRNWPVIWVERGKCDPNWVILNWPGIFNLDVFRVYIITFCGCYYNTICLSCFK